MHMSRLLIIDNKDSFTWNIWQLAVSNGADASVISNTTVTPAYIREEGYTHLIVGPGPMGPRQSGNSISVIEQLSGTIPVLGICLGMQVLALLDGSTIKPHDLLHGGQDTIFHEGKGVHAGLPLPFRAARYNSLSVFLKENSGLEQTAHNKNGTTMAVKHKKHRFTEGIQYHPESFMTSEGDRIMTRFLSYSYTTAS